jgi:hypothetical protein
MSRDLKIDANWVNQVLKLVESRGLPVEQILREIDLDSKQLSQPDTKVPFAKYVALVEASSRRSNNPCFGLHLGSSVNLLDAGLLGYITASSATLGDALNNLTKYQVNFSQGGRISLEDEGLTAAIVFELLDPKALATRQFHETSMAIAMNVCRFVTNQHGNRDERLSICHRSAAVR